MINLIENKTLILITVFTIIYAYLKYYVYNYWKRYGIPHKKPSVPLGNISISNLFAKITLGNLIKENYEKFKQFPFHGFYVFYKPIIVINDPDLIRTVLVKEFSRFQDRGWFVDDKVDPMTNNLFLQNEDKWKNLRKKFSPMFTPNKLRQVYPLMVEISNEMINICNENLKISDELEIKDIIARYTTDIISSVVYGFNCNSLQNPTSEFRRCGIKAFEFGRISMLFAIWHPEILKKFSVAFFHKEVRDFFQKIFDDALNLRRSEKIKRKDFVNLLLQLIDHGELEDDNIPFTSSRDSKENNDRISLADAAAQALVFYLAGYETSSTTATYCLLELAINLEIQEKLREEIDLVADSSTGFTYDNIMDMEYLEMVFSETIRKYSPVAFLNRICVEEFSIPNSNYTIPKGMRVLISSSGIQNDPNFFPEPEKFDPSRFTKENLATRSSYVHLGFGEGPHNCIGKRFGTMQAKQALVALLYNYKFRVSNRTKLPIHYDTESFIQSPVEGIYLHLEKRRK